MTQDLIDREALLNQLEETYNYVCIYNDNNDFSCGLREGIHIAISRTNELPSVKPERSEGLRVSYMDGFNDGYKEGWEDGQDTLKREI